MIFTISFGVMVLVGGGLSFYMYRRDKRSKQPAASDEQQTMRHIPKYKLSTWIDDEVAKRQLYHKPNISVAELAKELGLEERELRHIIHSTYGKPVTEYLDERRIQRACSLLREQLEMSLEDIQKEIGFSSMKTFLSLFEHTMGQDPLQYRRQMTPR